MMPLKPEKYSLLTYSATDSATEAAAGAVTVNQMGTRTATLRQTSGIGRCGNGRLLHIRPA